MTLSPNFPLSLKNNLNYQNPLPTRASTKVANTPKSSGDSYTPNVNSMNNMIAAINRSVDAQASNQKYSASFPYLRGSILDTKV
jgi:hypothetical protein